MPPISRGLLFGLLVVVAGLAVWPQRAYAKSQDAGKAPAENRESQRATQSIGRNNRVALPAYSIEGRVQSIGTSCRPAGRQVVVIISRDGRSVFSQSRVLDATGGCDYRFSLPGPLGPGRYVVRVEKGSPNPGAYACTANLCLDRITPANRTVELDAAHSSARNQDFSISYLMAWDRAGWCW